MFERFTDRARHVVALAQEEARELGHDHIGTEHVLLGLLREDEGVAYTALRSLGMELADVRDRVVDTIGTSTRDAPSGHIPFTPRAKRTMDQALRESARLGSNEIDTQGLLLGLLQSGDGVAVRVLGDVGVRSTDLRDKVLELAPAARPRRGRGSAEADTSTERWDRLEKRLDEIVGLLEDLDRRLPRED
jgi:ATP-dependent Clp protease ATP-binding subunit ClpC